MSEANIDMVMYGLVNRAIKEMVIEGHGLEVWQSVAEGAGVDACGFVDLSTYDDKITYDLVASASELLDVSADKVLRDFGKHWVLYTGGEEWGFLFDLAGNDFLTFLKGLDNLHARVEAQLPECRVPQFTVLEYPDHVELQYHSHREGLAPMVAGLLEGLMEHFDEKWQVLHASSRSEQGYDIFTLLKVEDEIIPKAA